MKEIRILTGAKTTNNSKVGWLFFYYLLILYIAGEPTYQLTETY